MPPRFLALAAVVGLATVAVAASKTTHTEITVWSGTVTPATGGMTYGAVAPSTGALVVEHRDVDLVGDEVRFENVSHALDPGSVQLRDLSDPGLVIVEQRYLRGAVTPTEMIGRHLGEAVVVGTAKGELSGTLRAVDEQTLAIEVAGRIEVVRRDFAQTVRLATTGAQAALIWRVRNAKPGKHALELSYRTDLMAWNANYVAILDDTATTADFSAWATIRNFSGSSFGDAQVTLVGPKNSRFPIAAPVHLAGTDDVAVELMPAKRGAKAHAVVAIQATAEPVLETATENAQECASGDSATGLVEPALELDLPVVALPEGKVRIFRRTKDHLEVVGEDDFAPVPGKIRLKLTGDVAITYHRNASNCVFDDAAHTLHEKVDIVVDNAGKQGADVVVRDYLWRNKSWKLVAETPKSTPVDPQQREFRVHVGGGGKQTISYDVLYTW